MKQQKLQITTKQKQKIHDNKGQKVAVTFTIFTDNAEYIEWFALEYIKQLNESLKYELLKQTVGLHKDANRKHYHICCIFDLNNGKKYKCLNEKIIRFQDTNNIIFTNQDYCKIFNETEKKITFIYEGQQKKSKNGIKLYDETGLQYPFKEYESYNDIMVDLQFGFSELELEQMRKCANIEWLNVKRKQSQFQAQEIEKSNQQQKFQDFLKDKLQHLEGTFTYLVRETIKAILLFKKTESTTTSFRVMGLKDQAISFLYLNGYITEDEIILYLDI